MTQGEKNGLVLRYRNFRLRHNISLQELAENCGISAQRISQIELGGVRAPRKQEKLVQAMESVLLNRKRNAAQSLTEFQKEKRYLFEWEQEWR